MPNNLHTFFGGESQENPVLPQSMRQLCGAKKEEKRQKYSYFNCEGAREGGGSGTGAGQKNGLQ